MKQNYKKYALWSIAIVVVVLIVARILLSPVIVSAINNWFADQGIDSEVEDLSFDIYNGEMVLSGLRAIKSENRTLSLERLKVEWSWSALFEHQLMLDSVAVSGLALEAAREPDGRLVFAAIDFASDAQAEAEQQAASSPEASQWSIALRRLAVEAFEICYRNPPKHDYCNGFESLEWDGSMVIDLSRLADTALPLQAQGDFRLSALKVQNNRLQRRMLGFDEFVMQGISIDDLELIEIESTTLDNLTMLEKKDDPDDAEVTRLEKLQVEQLRLEQLNRLEIANITVLNQQGRLIKQDDDRLETSEWLQEYQNEAADSAAAPTANEAPFSFAIDRIEYNTDRSLQYVDLSLTNTFVIDLNHIKLSIEGLDSADPEKASKIDYQASYAKHGKISFSGTATPFDPTPTLNLSGTIKGLDLPELSAFTADAIGHRIKSGQLDANIELKAVDSVLDSKIDLKLDHLQLSAVSDKDSERVDNSLGFPLNTSLSLLKDRNDLIELSIPVTGDINSPGFDPTDAITQATSAAITTAVLTYYTPFGLVSVVDGLFSLATALRFDPVVFDAGNGDIAGIDNAGLEKIAGLMQERPGVHVTLCAYTNSADRTQLLPETAEIASDELELDDAQVAVLEQLGETRRDQVEDFLVSQGIDPARLVSCDTEHREGTGLAGVEISI